jgi:hypothetical protein
MKRQTGIYTLSLRYDLGTFGHLTMLQLLGWLWMINFKGCGQNQPQAALSHSTCLSGHRGSGLRLKPRTSWIWGKSTDHSTTTLSNLDTRIGVFIHGRVYQQENGIWWSTGKSASWWHCLVEMRGRNIMKISTVKHERYMVGWSIVENVTIRIADEGTKQCLWWRWTVLYIKPSILLQNKLYIWLFYPSYTFQLS